jgi:hypothetical protein
MPLPVLRGVIERRILCNYSVDLDVMARVLPAPFRPLPVRGRAVGGICLIRLGELRPRGLPVARGFHSENAAHRVAVVWEDPDGRTQEGVYIPRRDTSSRLVVLAGGRLFPGEHHHARFRVEESPRRVHVAMASDDGQVQVEVEGTVAAALPPESVFGSLAEASSFFERGSLGYSATRGGGAFEGLELSCRTWSVTPLAVERARSSFFEDRERFPHGSVRFDSALLMRDVHHEWHGRAVLRAPAVAGATAGA